MAGKITSNHDADNRSNITATSAKITFTASDFSYSKAQTTTYSSSDVYPVGSSGWIATYIGDWGPDPSDDTFEIQLIAEMITVYYHQDWTKHDYGGLQYSWSPNDATTSKTTITFSGLTEGVKNSVTASVSVTVKELQYSAVQTSTSTGSQSYYKRRRKSDQLLVPSIQISGPTLPSTPTSLGRPSFSSTASNTVTHSVGSASLTVQVYTRGAGFSFAAVKDTSKINNILTSSKIAAWNTACKAYRQWKAQAAFTMPVGCDASSGGTVTAAWYNACVKAKTGAAGGATANTTRITAALINALDISYS